LIDKIQTKFNQSQSINETLVGEINHEYKLTLPNKAVSFIKKSVEPVATNSTFLNYINYAKTPEYTPGSNKIPNYSSLTYKGEAWVNFQQKHEYNPPHSHTGIFSFVIWYQIPYYLKDEALYNAGLKRNTNGPLNNGNFQFLYPIDDRIYPYNLDIDKTKEGYMAIFPSLLTHTVFPFYSSDEYRITISGNIYLK